MARPNVLAIGSMIAQLKGGLQEHFDIHSWPDGDPGDFLARVGPSITGVAIGGTDNLPNTVMDALPALEVISCYGVGYDGIDAERAAQRGIMVSHTPDVLNDEVANTGIALLLAVMRRVVAYDRYVREGRWETEGSPPLTHGLAGKTVGIVGLGRIGLALADKLAVFGCKIVYHNRRPRDDVTYGHYADLVEMARDSDVLALVVPGGPETSHIVNREVLDALGSEGTLINIARGSIVDEPEMIAALQDGRLGAAGLDAFEDGHHVPETLCAMDNVVLLPHVGSATVETRGAMGRLVIDNLVSWYDRKKVMTPVPECRHLQE